MNDADQQRLNEIRAKLRRISGHKQLSARQMESLRSLVQESETLIGEPIDELFE